MNLFPIILYAILFIIFIKKISSYKLKYTLLGLLIAEVFVGYLRHLVFVPLSNLISKAATFRIVGNVLGEYVSPVYLFKVLEWFSRTYLIGWPCVLLSHCSGEGCMICFFFWPLPLIVLGIIGFLIGWIIKRKNSSKATATPIPQPKDIKQQ